MPDNDGYQVKWALPFFTLWTGQALSLLGSRIATFALVWWLTEITASATILTTAYLVAFLPGVILGPFIGALVDRWNRRTVMLIADTIIALISIGLIYLFWSDTIQVWHIYVVGFIRATGGTFQSYAMSTSTTLMVPEKHLGRVQGGNQTLNGLLNISAPPLGALMLSILPFHLIMAIDVTTALFAILPLFFIKVPQPVAGDVSETDAPSISLWSEVQIGLKYIWQWSGLRGALIIGASMNFFLNADSALLPILVTDHFNGEAIELGWLTSGFGVGIVFGGVLLTIWGGFKRRMKTTICGWFIAGFSTCLIGFAPSYAFWVALIGTGMSGISSALINGPFNALMQAKVAPNMQGRIFSVYGSLSQVTTMLGLLVAGPLADIFGVRFWFIAGGGFTLLLSIIAIMIPVIVHLEDDTDEANTALLTSS